MRHSGELTEADGSKAAGACEQDVSPLRYLKGQEGKRGEEKGHMFMPRRERGGSRDRGGEEGKGKTRERTEENLKMCPQRGPLLPIRPYPLKVPQPLQQQLEEMFTQTYEPVGGGQYYIAQLPSC